MQKGSAADSTKSIIIIIIINPIPQEIIAWIGLGERERSRPP
jgi:hypothetical protein